MKKTDFEPRYQPDPSDLKRDYYTVTVANTFPKLALEEYLKTLTEDKDGNLVKELKGGVKHDQGKPDLTMIPYEALEEIAKVLMFGASKYGKNNWKKGISTTRLAGAALRHLGSWCDGVDLDSESNLNHLTHSATNLLMLIWMLKHKPEQDDR